MTQVVRNMEENYFKIDCLSRTLNRTSTQSTNILSLVKYFSALISAILRCIKHPTLSGLLERSFAGSRKVSSPIYAASGFKVRV